MHKTSFCLLFLGILAAAPSGQPVCADGGHFLAVFTNGERVDGQHLTGWHTTSGKPSLDSIPLDADEQRLRWLRDRRILRYDAAREENGYIEFISGDRFPARVVEFVEATGDTPEHLVVESHHSLRLPHAQSNRQFRVVPRGIRRIVFERPSKKTFNPQWIQLRNGRSLEYLNLRWQSDGLSVLTDAGTKTFQFDDLAEVHFPAADPWSDYFRELAILSPNGAHRVLRFETTHGLLATGSEATFEAIAQLSADEQTAEQSLREHLQTTQRNLQNQQVSLKRQIEKQDELKLKHKATHKRLAAEAERREEGHGKRREEQMAKYLRDQKSNFTKQLANDTRRHKDAIERLERQLKDASENERRNRVASLRRQQEQELKRRKSEFDRRISQHMRQQQQHVQRLKQNELRQQKQRDSNLQRNLSNTQRNIDRCNARQATLDQQIAAVKEQLTKVSGHSDYSATPNRWYHKIQPAWCLDPLWVRFNSIRTRLIFQPNEVPLSRFAPDVVEQRSGFGKTWQWQIDRNVHGDPLVSGEQVFAWGFGVHATNELHFLLPDLVKSFKCSIGLDGNVEDGGCVRAEIRLQAADAVKTLYKSETIVGSSTTVKVGPVDLKQPVTGQRRLILLVDSAVNDRPDGADPFDIRDHFNWLEPILELDRDALQSVLNELAP